MMQGPASTKAQLAPAVVTQTRPANFINKRKQNASEHKAATSAEARSNLFTPPSLIRHCTEGCH